MKQTLIAALVLAAANAAFDEGMTYSENYDLIVVKEDNKMYPLYMFGHE